MSNFSNFESDADLTAWFEGVNLEGIMLDDAPEVVVASRVELTVTDPWPAPTSGARSGPSANIKLVPA
jgi:hypothetical protein